MTSLSMRLYRLLLRCVAPAELRAEYGEEIEHVFSQLLEQARGRGWPHVLRLWFQEIRQLFGIVRTLSHPDLTPRQSIRRRVWRFFEPLILDARLAALNLSRRPFFTSAVVVTLAVGIGLTLVVYSAARVSVLAPLPIPGADRVVVVTGAFASPEWSGRTAITARELHHLGQSNESLDGLAAFSLVGDLALTTDDHAERMRVTFVSPSYFSVIAARPEVGQLFPRPNVDPESSVGTDRLAVLSHDAWKNRFHSDPAVVGRSIELAGKPYTVIGVMAEDHWGLARSPSEFDAWLPIGRSEDAFGDDILQSLDNALFWGVGRLRSGVTIGEAQAELAGRHKELALEAGMDSRRSVDVMDLGEFYYGGSRRLLAVIGFGAALVLIVCGLNVGFLTALRARQRQDELSVRLSLGGSRVRIGQTFAAEAVLLASLGALAALLVGQVAIRTFLSDGEGPFLRFSDVHLDLPLALTGLGLALCATVLPTLVATMRSAVGDPRPHRAVNPRSRAIRSGGVVAAETALAVIALVVATLCVRSLEKLNEVELGYEPEGLEALRLSLTGTDHGDWWGPGRFARTLTERLSVDPHTRVGVMGPDMMGRSSTYVNATPEGLDPRLLEHRSRVQWISLTPGTLATLGVDFIEGRDVSWSDRPGDPIATVLSARTAQTLWPGEPAVGKRFHLKGSDRANAVVVGVVRPARHIGRYSRSSVVGDVYFSLQQQPTPSVSILYRPSAASIVTRETVEQVVHDIDRRVAPFDRRPMTVRLGEEERGLRLLLSLSALYGLIALALALCGMVSLIAAKAHERRRELAVRGALGGGPTQLVWTLTRGTLMALFVGVGVGTLAALTASRSVAGVLYDVSSHDPATYATVPLLLVLLGTLSSWLPARRSAIAAPAEVMRLN